MENANSCGLARTKSDQLVESVVASLKSAQSSHESIGVVDGGGTSSLSRKSSWRMMAGSPSRGGSKNTHIRKTSSGVALSRASSASMDLSFSFSGLPLPPDEIAESKPFSDDDIRKFLHNLIIFTFTFFISPLVVVLVFSRLNIGPLTPSTLNSNHLSYPPSNFTFIYVKISYHINNYHI